jgi:formylglycine-generating enzyme required for sulfatase activity
LILPRASNAIVWTGGYFFADNVDVGKIKAQARLEQIQDTLKRIFDASNHPRDEHLSTTQRLISAQGLFWLSELAEINDIKDWITDTRFFKDIYPSSNQQSRNVELRVKKEIDIALIRKFIFDTVKIPAGKYCFGSTIVNIDNEPPANFLEARIKTFSIMKFPVTNQFWNSVFGDSDQIDFLNHPRVNVNFFEASVFATTVEQLLRQNFPDEMHDLKISLPTEYQWEAAARGTSAFAYPWGNEFLVENCNCEMSIRTTTEKGRYSPQGDSPFGCQDMAGNVREWTKTYAGTRGVDWQLHSERQITDEQRVILPSSRLIIKGGSYSYDSQCVQSWIRNTQIASRKDNQTGFRLIVHI